MGEKLQAPYIIRALEFFSGIGGFAVAASGTNIRVVNAFDQSALAREVYLANFPRHLLDNDNLEHITPEKISEFQADFWWLSPPCQPYTVRGKERDERDPRAASLKRLLEILSDWPESKLPHLLALENVEGFAKSRMRKRLIELLKARGFQSREVFLCPTAWGIPMRRPRYYLVASRGEILTLPPPRKTPLKPIVDYLDIYPKGEIPPELMVSPEVVKKFGPGFHIIDPGQEDAYATCFTSGYGRSYMRAGSYVKAPGGVRWFSPEEILRLMGFPPDFSFPPSISVRKRWRLVGNSLSVTVVRYLLSLFPEVRFFQKEPLMIISGGQTGADRAALDFAVENSVPHGGWVPRGRLAEDGVIDIKYRVWEMPTSSYAARTEKNVLEADGTLIVSRGPLTGGSSFTRHCAILHGKPWLHVNLSEVKDLDEAAERILRWKRENSIVLLNVAGPRASSDELIYGSVLELLRKTFRRD